MFRRTLTPSTNDDESPMSVRSRNKRDCSFLPSDWSVTTKALSHMTPSTKGLFKGGLKLLFGKLFHSDMHADTGCSIKKVKKYWAIKPLKNVLLRLPKGS